MSPITQNDKAVKWPAVQYLIPISISAACIMALVYVRGTPTGGRSRAVVVEPSTHDFGDVPQRENLEQLFRLRNNGNTPITITASKSTCSCTLANDQFLGTTVLPGDQCELPVLMKTGDSEGLLSSRVTVLYADVSGAQVVEFDVKANVIPDYIVEPRMLDFGELVDDEPKTLLLKVVPKAANNIRVTNALSSNDRFVIGRIGEEIANQGVEIPVTFQPAADATTDAHVGLITLTTDSTRAPTVEVSLLARCVPALTVEPSAVVFPADASLGQRRFLTLRARADFTIEKLTCDRVEFTAEATGQHTARVQVIEVILQSLGKSISKGDIRVDISRQERGERKTTSLSIPVWSLATSNGD